MRYIRSGFRKVPVYGRLLQLPTSFGEYQNAEKVSGRPYDKDGKCLACHKRIHSVEHPFIVPLYADGDHRFLCETCGEKLNSEIEAEGIASDVLLASGSKA